MRIRFIKILPILVLTFRLKGGLNQIIFLFRFIFPVLVGGENFMLILCPLESNAFSYIGLAISNSFSLHEMLEILWLIIIGSCFKIVGGWFEFVFMYKGTLLGLRYG